MKTYACTAITVASLFLTSCGHLPPRTTSRNPAKVATSENTHKITFVCNGYKGRIALDQGGVQGDFFFPTGPEFVRELAPGKYTVAVDRVGRSGFDFEVSPSGDVENVSNPTAASGQGSKLSLNTTTVTVIPGPLGAARTAGYLAAYPFPRFPAIERPSDYKLIPGLVYQYESGIKSARSAFIFEVGADGTVWSNAWAAHGGPGVLKPHAGWIDVTPPEGNLTPYYFGKSKAFKGKSRVPIVFGLETGLIVGDSSERITVHYDGIPRNVVVKGMKFRIEVPWIVNEQGTRRGKGR